MKNNFSKEDFEENGKPIIGVCKPIFLIQSDGIKSAADRTSIQAHVEKLQLKMPDWHVIYVHNTKITEPKFQAFNFVGLPDIDIEQLKKEIGL